MDKKDVKHEERKFNDDKTETSINNSDGDARNDSLKIKSEVQDSTMTKNVDIKITRYSSNSNIRKRKKMISLLLAILPLIILAGMVYFLLSPYGQNLINTGVPLPEVTIEKVEFHENQVVAFIRNTGPEQVTIAQADINDRIQAAAIEPSPVLTRLSEAKVMIPFLWNTAEPYEVGITTSDGTRFSKIIEAAAPAPIPNINQFLLFALLGVFVGVIPVLIGLAWYPFMRKITTNQYNFFLSLTAGLLVFLGIDAFLESNEIAVNNLAATFNGQMLVFVTVFITFLGLFSLSRFFSKRAEGKNELTTKINSSSQDLSSLRDKDKLLLTSTSNNQKDHNTEKQKYEEHTPLTYQQKVIKPLIISLMIAIGIGLHNFGEGLAIGAAVLLGEIALSTFLIVGFTIHNTTEGLAIVAPLAKTGKLMVRRLVLMGLIAGVPTILGTWIGGFIYSPLASIIFLAIGAGAIFQVVFVLASWMLQSLKLSNASIIKKEDASPSTLVNSKNTSNSNAIVAGFIVGMLIMYITGLLV